MSGGYPLDALGTLREHAEDRAAERFADALEALARAEQTRRRAAEALAAHRSPAAGPPGRTTGAAMRASAAHRAREGERRGALREALARAEAAEARAGARVSEARAALANAAAEREVVARHRERWSEAKRKARERMEERER